jgi:DNA-binding NarL/FixJ family response regulator
MHDPFATAQSACLTPYEFADLDEWRDAICDAVTRLVWGTAAQVSLDPLPGRARMRSPSLDAQRIAQYVREWLPRDPVLPYVRDRGIEVYSRSRLAAEDHQFGAQYLASPVFNDFYVPTGARDSIGIVRQGARFAQVMAFSPQFGSVGFGEAGVRWMQLLRPAFLAGADAVFAVQEAHVAFERLIDDLPTPLGLWSLAGARLHRNTALQALLAAHPAPRTIERAIDRLAAALVQRAGPRATPAEVTRAVEHRVGGCRLSGTVARLGLLGAPPLVMVRVDPPSVRAVGATRVATLPLLGGLTARQRTVAVLIAQGKSNAEIAAALGVTVHTAKRHTEQVLVRLGARDRLQVAALLAPLLHTLEATEMPA